MPDNHKKFVQWNGNRFVSWAQSVGTNTTITVQAILASHRVEQQGYRSCLALLKLADKYGIARLEAACVKALSYTPSPNYRSVKTILSTGQDQVLAPEPVAPATPSDEHGFIRGAAYYGRE